MYMKTYVEQSDLGCFEWFRTKGAFLRTFQFPSAPAARSEAVLFAGDDLLKEILVVCSLILRTQYSRCCISPLLYTSRSFLSDRLIKYARTCPESDGRYRIECPGLPLHIGETVFITPPQLVSISTYLVLLIPPAVWFQTSHSTAFLNSYTSQHGCPRGQHG